MTPSAGPSKGTSGSVRGRPFAPGWSGLRVTSRSTRCGPGSGASTRRRERRGGEEGEVLAPLVERLPDPADDPFERVAKARRDATVRTAIQSLPDGQRRALTMFHLEGLGYQEIAVRLEVPLGTVATWVMRGRKAVASAVADLARE